MRRELTLRVSEEQFQKLRLLVYQLEISKQQALSEALDLWITKKKGQTNANGTLQKMQQ